MEEITTAKGLISKCEYDHVEMSHCAFCKWMKRFKHQSKTNDNECHRFFQVSNKIFVSRLAKINRKTGQKEDTAF